VAVFDEAHRCQVTELHAGMAQMVGSQRPIGAPSPAMKND
jgi:hypothetical protein